EGMGIESLMRAGDKFGPDLSSFIVAVRDIGLSIHITELDVVDSHLTGSITERDGTVAQTYKRFLDLILATRSVSTVIT
ncbi:endo-1,4-beta-xylanase, partial [Pseudomonas syringae group genomosp. 7]|uniref:endo-1,4-beta-xylanase n=1 Tax=Pseudomonas syringae group genomosp. 7 TaxID=251699 RepID=UPI00376F7E2F